MTTRLFHNGNIYTPADPYATALLTENGTNVWVGSNAGAQSIADPTMDIIDLNGKLITPSFARAFAPIYTCTPQTLYSYLAEAHSQGYHTHTLTGKIQDIPALHASLSTFHKTFTTTPDIRFFLTPDTHTSPTELIAETQKLLNNTSISLTGLHITHPEHAPTYTPALAQHNLVLSLNAQDSPPKALKQALTIREQYPWLSIRLDQVHTPLEDQQLQALTQAHINLGLQATPEIAPLTHHANTAGTAFAIGSDPVLKTSLGWQLITSLIKPTEGISARSGFTALTRGVYRLAHEDNPFTGQIIPDTPANIALWDITELMVQTPDSRISSWSTDPRARVPLLPVLSSDVPLPTFVRLYAAGFHGSQES